MRNDLIAVLDLGSSKVACLIAYVDSEGGIRVAGVGHQISKGIKAGIVIDVKKAENAILAAVSTAEKIAGETIDRVFVNIAGSSVNSHHISAEIDISGNEVTDKDINQIIIKGKKHFDKNDVEILHCIPNNYSIDDSTGIGNPIGMCGEKLSTDLHVITCSPTAVKNIVSCLARCHLNVQEFVCDSYVSALACLTEDEKNLGVTHIDIGGGCASISVFMGGSCVYTSSVALGGSHVTKDIAIGLSTSVSYAERVKTLYGSVISTDNDMHEIIDIPFDENENLEEPVGDDINDMVHISKAELVAIIKPRMEEILEMVKQNLESSKFGHVVGSRVVITGGGSQIGGLKELANYIFGKQARIGRPEYMEGLAESAKGPAFSSAIGMLKHATERRGAFQQKVIDFESFKKKGQMDKVIRWLQQNF